VSLNAGNVVVLLQLAKHAIQQLIITTIQTLVNFAMKELFLLELIANHVYLAVYSASILLTIVQAVTLTITIILKVLLAIPAVGKPILTGPRANLVQRVA
jgi:hypothetical protein